MQGRKHKSVQNSVPKTTQEHIEWQIKAQMSGQSKVLEHVLNSDCDEPSCFIIRELLIRWVTVNILFFHRLYQLPNKTKKLYWSLLWQDIAACVTNSWKSTTCTASDGV
jgi:hypothetical protein